MLGTGRVHLARQVQYLITEQGCDPMCRGFGGRAPLHCAYDRGHLDVVKYLIDDQKVDPSCRDEAPLHIACVTGQLSVVRVLVEDYLCDPGLRDSILVMTATCSFMTGQNSYSTTSICSSWYKSCSLVMRPPGLTSGCRTDLLLVFNPTGYRTASFFPAQSKSNIQTLLLLTTRMFWGHTSPCT